MKIYLPPFLLIKNTGEAFVFPTLGKLAKAASKKRIIISDYHVKEKTWQWRLNDYDYNRVESEWIVRDDQGELVSSSAVWQSYREENTDYQKHWFAKQRAKQKASDAGLAIPGTGKTTRYRNYLRYPHHLGAHREAAGCDSILGDNSLPGKVKLPPTNWDDRVRGDYNHRCWKRHRRYQAKNR